MRRSRSRNRVAMCVLSSRLRISLLSRFRASFLLLSSVLTVCSSSLIDCISSVDVSSSSLADCSSSFTDWYSSFADFSSSLAVSCSSIALCSCMRVPRSSSSSACTRAESVAGLPSAVGAGWRGACSSSLKATTHISTLPSPSVSGSTIRRSGCSRPPDWTTRPSRITRWPLANACRAAARTGARNGLSSNWNRLRVAAPEEGAR